jgi:hypothetical protein
VDTISIGIQNLCIPCGCACKYCLLQSCKQGNGVDYFRGKKLAERFAEWGRVNNASDLPFYNIGYCAEYPELYDNIRFNKSLGFQGASFLQCNGMMLRNIRETDELIKKLKMSGISMIDTTFFGNEQYHDLFSARIGDYSFMMQHVKSAVENGITCGPTLVITEKSKSMLDDIYVAISRFIDSKSIHSFLPDYRGRGYLLEDIRITGESYLELSDAIRSTINITRYKTEKDWLTDGKLPEFSKRALIIALREDNIHMLENMTCDEIVSYVESWTKIFTTQYRASMNLPRYMERRKTQNYIDFVICSGNGKNDL